MMLVWNADNDGGTEGPVTSEEIIKDIDKVSMSIIKIIQHRGTVVRELDKDTVQSRLTDILAPEALGRAWRSSWLLALASAGPADPVQS